MEQMLGEAIYGEPDDGVPQFLKDAAAERQQERSKEAERAVEQRHQERLAAKLEVFDAAKRIASGNGTKADKTKVRIEKMKAAKTVKEAELTGKRRRMPLTGRAALDAIKAK